MVEDRNSIARSGVDQASAQFIEWFSAVDGTRLSTKIQLKDLSAEGAGRGAVAKEDIAEDEELFAVPHPLVLMTSTSSIPPSVLEPLAESGSWPPLIVTIIYEYLCKESSPWYPYFRVLPTTFDTLMFWNEAELAELQAGAVTDKIGRAEAEQAWKDTIIPIMLEHPDLFPIPGAAASDRAAELIKLAHMAGSLIMAYAFDIDRDEDDDRPRDGVSEDEYEEDDEDEPLKGMVPFADMLNADADRNNARLFQEENYLIMKATKSIAAGEQIFNDYGPLPRSDLLRMYGYVTDKYAKHDVVEFSHDLILEVAGKKHDKNNKAWLKREEQLDELGLLDDGYSIPRPDSTATKLEDVIPGQVHMLLRALCAHEQDETPKKPKEAVSIGEAALLQSVLTKRLSEYSTTYSQDRATWESVKSGHHPTPQGCIARRFAMALQVRMGEKEILQQLISFCQQHIERMSAEIATAKRKRSDETTQQARAKKRR
ncbi:SET domain-containing protein 6 [Exophiala viscosa]|uniref:SET domain-containing protein 6 n=1 Tax=Exophiala viscosa TaxID=2486360 RepID=A0AAN6DKV8_9EURO|nr:SET domain-containing protein 6 [Exophiala viscosa]KAI1628486.1 SET domain-containing protein 6 [Exophiala viscosa]